MASAQLPSLKFMSLGLAQPCTVQLCTPENQAVAVDNPVPLTDTATKEVAGGLLYEGDPQGACFKALQFPSSLERSG